MAKGVRYNGNMISKFLSLFFPPSKEYDIAHKCSVLVASPYKKTVFGDKNILTIGDYKHNPLKAVIKEQKKHGSKHTSKLLAALLADILLEEIADTAIWNSAEYIITAIPPSFDRRRVYGFDHLHLILNHLPDTLTHNVAKKVLSYTRTVAMQKRLTRSERLQNMHGAFVANPKMVTGKIVYIIDDITTTGATLAEAMRAVQDAGGHPIGIALARA